MRTVDRASDRLLGREILLYCLPLVASNILQQLYNTAGTLIAGTYINQAAFAALGIAGTVVNLFIFILSGLSTGVSILLARVWGAGNKKEFNRTAFTFLVWGTAFTILLSAAGIVFGDAVLHLLQTPDELYRHVFTYYGIVVVGMVFTFLYNAFSAIFRSIGNSRISMYILGLSMFLYVTLAIVFQVVFGLGVMGIALATVLSQLFSAVCCIVFYYRHCPQIWLEREEMSHDWKVLRSVTSYGAIAALQQSSLYIGKIIIQGAVNPWGTDVISAYAACAIIESFIMAVGNGADATTGVFVSQSFGARNQVRAGRSFWLNLRYLLLFGVAVVPLLMLLTPWLLGLMVTASGTPANLAGTQYLRVVAPFYMSAFCNNILNGYLRGIGRMSIPFAGSTMQIILRASLSALLISRMGLGGVALASGIGWSAQALFLLACYLLCNRRMRAVSAQAAAATHT